MPIDFPTLATTPRLLLDAELRPLQGTRFQPTGFPDLGPARYEGPNNEPMLLVESAQSMANRMEKVCWDDAADDWIAPLKGLPLVKVIGPDGVSKTNSVLEAHRLNSEYIARTPDFVRIAGELGFASDRAFNVRTQLVPFLLKYDINTLLHGIFLEEIAGVIRLPRALSSFIEAKNVRSADSGGVKINRNEPTLKDGEGNVIFGRTEFVAETITACFNLDLAQLRGYGLGSAVERLLIALALLKIRVLLDEGLRLRTACDLECLDVKIKRPAGWTLPERTELEAALPALIETVAAEHRFAEPRVTLVRWEKGKSAGKGKKGKDAKPAAEPADDAQSDLGLGD